jgi:AraC family ethanolamine operon transcriptional activator
MGRAWSVNRRGSCEALVIDSIEALKRPIDGAEAEIVQLGKGRLTGTLTRATIGNLGLSRGSFSLPLRATGVLSRNRLTIATFLDNTAPFRGLLGDTFAPGDMVIVPPGGEHHAVYTGPTAYAGVTIDPIELAWFFGGEGPLSDPEYWTKRNHVRPASGRTPIEQGGLLQTVFARLASTEALPDAAADYLKRVVIEAFCKPLLGASGREGVSAVASSIRTVKEVEAYVDARQHRAVHISEICSALSISRRTLHRCFDDALGTSPGAFLRYKRLCSVHFALRSLDPSGAHVTQVATDFGFLELSRFAHQYRTLFAEYPHQTLQR